MTAPATGPMIWINYDPGVGTDICVVAVIQPDADGCPKVTDFAILDGGDERRDAIVAEMLARHAVHPA